MTTNIGDEWISADGKTLGVVRIDRNGYFYIEQRQGKDWRETRTGTPLPCTSRGLTNYLTANGWTLVNKAR